MTVHVRVPASIANFGPAFDAFALAVDLYNEIALDVGTRPEVRVTGEGAGVLPADGTNLVHRAAAAVAARTGGPPAFALACRNGIPIGRGLGSSAAAIVGGAVAANALAETPLAPAALLELAAGIEGHPDNVAAALFGGAVVLTATVTATVTPSPRSGAPSPRSGAAIPTPSGWTWARLLPAWDVEYVVAVPEFAVPTERARGVLPDRVPMHDAVGNIGRSGLLVAALLTGQVDLLQTAMDDALHQQYRAPLVPGMAEVFAAARRSGAYGAALSGSGPAIVAVCAPRFSEAAGAAMVHAFAAAGQQARYLRLNVDPHGAIVVPET